MRKSLLLLALLIVSQASYIKAQHLFVAPDTVCVNQRIQLRSNVPNKATHYWGFCSGYLYNKPTGDNLGSSFGFEGPQAIEVGQNDDGNYYAFVTDVGATPGKHEFRRLDFGKSLDNTPTVTSFGNMDSILPPEVNSMYLVRDQVDSNWYLFLTAGSNAASSELARIDFGRSLSNTPNIVSFGNLEGKLNVPRGMFVEKEDDKWYGFCVNSASNELIRFNMDSNISLTPSVTVINILGDALAGPSDIAALKDNGRWFFFIPMPGNNHIGRVRFPTGLADNSVQSTDVGDGNVTLGAPSAMSIVRDCDRIHGYITSKSSHDFVRFDMEDPTGPYEAVNFSNVGNILAPSSLTRLIRDRDNVYTFATNEADNSISRIKFAQCHSVDIQYSTTNKPPEYRYTDSGLYNIYYAVNEGMPDMQVECHLIYVLPIPPIIMDDDTLICQGDTATLSVLSINAISFTWSPNYNISSTSTNNIKVWPEYPVKYKLRMPFPKGCIVDTSIFVDVRKVKADAGPDRTIKDGATTILGGPGTSYKSNYLRRWFPQQYMDDPYSDNPIVRPPVDFTYYLEVVDTGSELQCSDIDTVVVYVDCDDINLPNAFMPEDAGARGRFGLLNSQLVKLSKFDIYDRWGKLVFTTTDPTQQWDGMVNGIKAPMGVYVYDVDGFCSSGRRVHKTGNVTLIR